MTAEQLTQGLVAVLPEILLLVLGFLVITVDLFMRRQTSRRSLGYLSIGGLLVVLAVVVVQMLPLLVEGAPSVQPVLGGMVRVDLMVYLFRIMFMVAAILTCVISLDYSRIDAQRRILWLVDLQHPGHGHDGRVEQHHHAVRWT